MKRRASLFLLTIAATPLVAAAQNTQVWSSPTRTEQVDPATMERAAVVPNPGPVDRRIVGAWDVWIPGAVTYRTDGRAVYQRYEPGAAMNRLEIGADGRYQWGDRKGRLVEVKPWHAQEGRRYWRVTDARGTEYELYHGDGDRLVVLFGGVGGHAATGTRLSGRPGARTTAATPATPAPTAPAPARPSAPAAPSTPASNPLGVEWVGGSKPAAPAQPSTAPSNPLGVEWVGGGSGGGRGGATPPTLPEPAPPTPPTTSGATDATLTSALADRWLYRAVAFVGNGTTTSETRGVGGSLVLENDGSYTQSLVIGGIGNNVKGTWRIEGRQLVTTYTWRGPTTDRHEVQLSADGKRLTLVLRGTTTAYYTLDRAE